MATKDYSSVQERRIADALGWEVVTGSGARPCVPGDVRSNEWLGECKTHTESGHRIVFMLDVWKKIQNEADASHRSPVIFADDGSQDLRYTWALCRSIAVDTTNLVTCRPSFHVAKNVSFVHNAVSDYLKSLCISEYSDISPYNLVSFSMYLSLTPYSDPPRKYSFLGESLRIESPKS